MAAAAASPCPDVASASSAALFRLRHLRLGLELRPEARALAGCLVLELCALRADRRRALVLDAHPALRVASVAFRACPAGGAAEEEEEEEEACRRRCAFVFPDAGQGGASSWGPGELGALRKSLPPRRALCPPTPRPRPGPPPPFADLPPAPEMPPPPLPAFPDAAAAFPLVFRVDPFTDYGSSLTVFLPSSLQPHQPFQVVVRYTTTDAPAVSIPSAAGVDPKEGFGGAVTSGGSFAAKMSGGSDRWCVPWTAGCLWEAGKGDGRGKAPLRPPIGSHCSEDAASANVFVSPAWVRTNDWPAVRL
ncbi:UNVERIFIED_CONTAM: hypothetical protein K2H54_062609 [Gekko kuhli]